MPSRVFSFFSLNTAEPRSESKFHRLLTYIIIDSNRSRVRVTGIYFNLIFRVHWHFYVAKSRWCVRVVTGFSYLQLTFQYSRTMDFDLMPYNSRFPLYFDIKIQGLSRTLKLHFQGPVLDRRLQHGQYYSNI